MEDKDVEAGAAKSAEEADAESVGEEAVGTNEETRNMAVEAAMEQERESTKNRRMRKRRRSHQEKRIKKGVDEETQHADLRMDNAGIRSVEEVDKEGDSIEEEGDDAGEAAWKRAIAAKQAEEKREEEEETKTAMQDTATT